MEKNVFKMWRENICLASILYITSLLCAEKKRDIRNRDRYFEIEGE